jgi:hypothetical protein
MSIDITLFDDPAILAKCRTAALADFPALKILWHMDDQIVDGVTANLTERFNGLTAVAATQNPFSKDATGVFYASDPGSYTLTGTWPVFTGKASFVPFAIGTCSSSGTTDQLLNFSVGLTTSGNFGFNASGASAVNTDLGTGGDVPMTSALASTDMSTIACFNVTNNIAHRAKGVFLSPEQSMAVATSTVAGASVSGLNGATISQAITLPMAPSNGSQKIAMCGVLAFATYAPSPATILAAARWMARYRGIYPGFLGHA